MDKQQIALQTLLSELADDDAPLRAALVYRLSDIMPSDLAEISRQWAQIDMERRRQLLTRLAETSESNFDVDFTEFALFALSDEDAEVRASAIAALWFNEEPRIMNRLLTLLSDESIKVRAAAAEALGRFVLAGELGDIPESFGHEVEDALLAVLIDANTEPLLHVRALESLAYCGREEVPALIAKAHGDPDIQMQASAIFAMGRSADERWTKQVVQALNSSEPQIRFEAARAAGELGLAQTVSKLIKMAHESDREIREMAIWSLGEIGGNEAQRALFQLADSETDEDLLEVIEDAVNSAQLAAGQFGAILLEGNSADIDFDEFDYADSDD